MAITIDGSGHAYVTGVATSPDFPTVNPIQASLQGNFDAFVAKFSPTGSSLIYSTYLGGSNDDRATGIAVDSSDNAYLVGLTSSLDFPTVDSVQPYGGGASDYFVVKINPAGSALTFATYLGGSSTESPGSAVASRLASGIAVDGFGSVYITGQTGSYDFPTTPGAFQSTFDGSIGAFATKIEILPPPLVVPIDIKPGSFPNSINLGSNGTVPVAILSTATFDATTVDPLTVTLASAPVRLKGKGTPMASFQDVNGDGRLDLVVHVETSALDVNPSDTEAVLEGKTFGGRDIRGTDSVRVVP